MTDETEAAEQAAEPIEPNSLTAEAESKTEAAEAAEASPAADEPDDEQPDKRMAKLAHDAREARRRTRVLEREIAVLRGQRTEAPDEELDRKVTERATQLAAQTAFNVRCNEIYHAGVKEFGKAEFDETVKELNEVLGGLPVALIEAAEDAGNPAKILKYLGDNSDIAEKLAAMTAHKMGVELAKLAQQLDKPKAQISKAPPPIKPLNGSSGNAATDIDKMSMADYMKHENQRRLQGYH